MASVNIFFLYLWPVYNNTTFDQKGAAYHKNIHVFTHLWEKMVLPGEPDYQTSWLALYIILSKNSSNPQ